MYLFAFTLIFVKVSATVLGNDNGHCIWYGVCYTNDEGKSFNCPYNGSGHPLDDEESKSIIQKRCPEIIGNNTVDTIDLCCDSEMIQIMEKSIVMASGIFGRCQTCLKNLLKSICALNCSPLQSQFLIPYNALNEDGVDVKEMRSGIRQTCKICNLN